MAEIEEVFQLPGPQYVDTENFFDDDFTATLSEELYVNDTNKVSVHSQQGINYRKQQINPNMFAGIREELWPDESFVDQAPMFFMNPSAPIAVTDGRRALGLEPSHFGEPTDELQGFCQQKELYFPQNCCPGFTGFNSCETMERSQCSALKNGNNRHRTNSRPGSRHVEQHYDIRQDR